MRDVDAYAKREGITRSDALRILLERGLRAVKARKEVR
jgi:hypothetical protein